MVCIYGIYMVGGSRKLCLWFFNLAKQFFDGQSALEEVCISVCTTVYGSIVCVYFIHNIVFYTGRDKSKKFSEQAAAGVCILVLQMQENGETTMTPPEMPYNRTKELARDCKRLRLDNSNEQNREKTSSCVSGADDQSSNRSSNRSNGRSNDRSNGDNVTKKT